MDKAEPKWSDVLHFTLWASNSGGSGLNPSLGLDAVLGFPEQLGGERHWCVWKWCRSGGLETEDRWCFRSDSDISHWTAQLPCNPSAQICAIAGIELLWDAKWTGFCLAKGLFGVHTMEGSGAKTIIIALILPVHSISKISTIDFSIIIMCQGTK